MDNLTTLILSSLLASLPLLLIGAVGAVLSHTRLKQTSAKAGRFATLGFGLIAAQALLGSIMRAYFLGLRDDGTHPVPIANGFTLIGLVTSIMLWVALILLLLAVLADRKVPESVRGAI